MEQNHSLLTIFLAILIASIMIDVFRGSFFMFFDTSNIQLYSTYYPIFVLVSILIHPFLIFILFYKLGKRFDLKVNLKPSIIRLLFGSYLGHFLGTNLIYLIIGGENYLSTLVGSIISTSFLATFFLSFSALAIAYLTNNIDETDDGKKGGF
jgi:Na+/melibiose symporter-like transporter